MNAIEFANKYLTEPERIRYLYNINNRVLTPGMEFIDKSKKYNGICLDFFIHRAFAWDRTPEKYYYWYHIERRLYGRRDDN